MTHPGLLYRDPWIIAVDKPSGLPSQATRDPQRDHLVAAVRRLLEAEPEAAPIRQGAPWLHHRLDVETSGALVLAVHPDANAGLTRAFRDRLAQKEYRAVVARPAPGALPPPLLEQPLRKERHRGRDRMVVTRSGGRSARTRVRALAPADGPLLLLELTPETGRMHQLRAHLAHAGFPILGDRLYGDALPRGLRSLAPRLMLHALRLTLPHPVTGQDLAVEAPLPPEFESVLADAGA